MVARHGTGIVQSLILSGSSSRVRKRESENHLCRRLLDTDLVMRVLHLYTDTKRSMMTDKYALYLHVAGAMRMALADAGLDAEAAVVLQSLRSSVSEAIEVG